MSATENKQRQPFAGAAGAAGAAGVTMRDLLASCAAAEAVSTPPRLPDPATAGQPPLERPKAA